MSGGKQLVPQSATGSCFTFRVHGFGSLQWRSVHVTCATWKLAFGGSATRVAASPGSQVGRRWTRTNEWKECEAGCVGCGRRSALPTATPRCRHSAGIPFTGGMFRHEIKKKKTQLFTDCSAPSQDVLSAAALAARPNQTSCKHLKATVKRLGRRKEHIYSSSRSSVNYSDRATSQMEVQSGKHLRDAHRCKGMAIELFA